MNPHSDHRGVTRSRVGARVFALLLAVSLLLTACVGEYVVGDWVWVDDGDGVQEAGEMGLSGVLVRLYKAGDTAPSDETRTDSDGFYEFKGVEEGTYFLEFVPPEGYSIVEPDRAEEDIDSDPDPSTGRTEEFKVGGGDDKTWDAGMFPSQSAAEPPTPTPLPPTATPVSEPEPTATPAVVVGPPQFGDELGDVLDCAAGTVAPEQDPAADIDTVTVSHNEDGSLSIEVFLVSPLDDPTEDFSFAVLITLIFDDGSTETALYEWHDGNLTQVHGEWTTLSNGQPGAAFNLPADVVGDRQLSEVQVQVFHMPTPDSLWVCDVFAFMPTP